jgi:hypothetical protein
MAMSAIHTLFCGLAALLAASVNAQTQPVRLQSGEGQIALLEVYTSEGCSSCPPAETWLSRLRGVSGLWKDFVPLAFHVDYWDYLGWRDPWGSKEFSDRQRAYAASWSRDSIYTPGFVLNGKEWRAWSGSKDGPEGSGGKVGVLKVSSSDLSHWQVSFTPSAHGAAGYEAYAASLAGGLTSDVKAGENRGRRLNHDFVVTALVRSSLRVERDNARGELILRGSPKGRAGRLALAVWVTRVGRLEPVQAAGGWLLEQGAE